MAIKKKALTVRLPLGLYRSSRKEAKRRQVSLNRLLEESLYAVLGAREEQQLYDAFGELGKHPDETDAGYAIHAQREVILRD